MRASHSQSYFDDCERAKFYRQLRLILNSQRNSQPNIILSKNHYYNDRISTRRGLHCSARRLSEQYHWKSLRCRKSSKSYKICSILYPMIASLVCQLTNISATAAEQPPYMAFGGSESARLHPITPADAHSPPAIVSTPSPETELVDQIESIDVTAHEIIILTSKVGPPDLLHVAITVVDIEIWNELPPINLTGIFILVTRGRYTINFLAPNRWYGVVFRCEQQYPRGVVGASLAPPPPPGIITMVGGGGGRVVNEEQHLVKTHKEDGSHLEAQPLVSVTSRRFGNGGKSLENLVITIKWEQHPSERPNLDAIANITLFCKQHIKYKQLRLFGRELEKSVEVKLDNHFEIMEFYNETRQIIASITPKNCPRICWNVELLAETPRGAQFRRAATRDCETIAAVSAATNLREYVGYALEGGNLRIRTNFSAASDDARGELDAYVQLVAVGLPEAKPRDNSTVRFKTYSTASHKDHNHFVLENLEPGKMYAIEYKYGKESPFAYAESRRFVVETPPADHEGVISSDALDGPTAPVHRQWPVRVIVERVPVGEYLQRHFEEESKRHNNESRKLNNTKEKIESSFRAAEKEEEKVAAELKESATKLKEEAAKLDADENLPAAVKPVNENEIENSNLWKIEKEAKEKLSEALHTAENAEHKIATELGEGAAKLKEGAEKLVDDTVTALHDTAAAALELPPAVKPVNMEKANLRKREKSEDGKEKEEFELHPPRIIMQLEPNFQDYEIGVDLDPFCELSDTAYASQPEETDHHGTTANEEREVIDEMERDHEDPGTHSIPSKKSKSHFWLTRDHPNRELRHLDVVGAVCGAQPGHALCRLRFTQQNSSSSETAQHQQHPQLFGRCAHDAKLCYTPSIRVRDKLYALDRRCVDVAKRLATQLAADEAVAKAALPTTAPSHLAAADEPQGNSSGRSAATYLLMAFFIAAYT